MVILILINQAGIYINNHVFEPYYQILKGQGEQHYMITFVSDSSVFSVGPPVSPTNKTDLNNITEIVLKVA